MDQDHPYLKKARAYLDNSLVTVEIVALVTIAIATAVAIVQEIWVMVSRGVVTLADLLLMFLYLEVLAMIGQYLRTGQIQVRFPLYIAIVALARYIIIDAKALDQSQILAIAGAILLLTFAVLVIRYGHMRFPYGDSNESLEVTRKDDSREKD